MNRPYTFKAEHVRKLRALRTELDSWNKAFTNAWNNQEYESAEIAMRQANLAFGHLVDYESKLVDWQKYGVPTSGYSK